jgi:hypothetical protein
MIHNIRGLEYETIKKGKYKYRVSKNYKFQLPFYFPECLTEFVTLEKESIYIAEDYAWDGATCAIDSPDFMRGSLIHDVMYQLIREKKLSKKDLSRNRR